MYKQYTDDTYSTLIPTHPSQGFVGPIIRGEVGEIILVHFRNLADLQLSIHPHGVRYDKQNEGKNRQIGSYMSAHVLLNLLNELGKRDEIRGLPSILLIFCNEFNKFHNTGERIVHCIYHCGRPWPAAYINIIQNTHQIQVLTEALCRAQAIFYSLPNNEWGTKYRGLTYSAK